MELPCGRGAQGSWPGRSVGAATGDETEVVKAAQTGAGPCRPGLEAVRFDF